eukprot:CAMPEP_0171060014 /NCGR_PEP_ID=MMETSP0766_2-20121228/3561_1 /TAXON_ID=439317 /ORGANISM="Gambierdiscus australes, Strain CAWD 149" /LENGTH=63 /DNA_ID=CAMNT_0011515535 /DNA_START=324 /DNA_END=511 /DNA_ORIENTATION=-
MAVGGFCGNFVGLRQLPPSLCCRIIVAVPVRQRSFPTRLEKVSEGPAVEMTCFAGFVKFEMSV